MRSKLLYHLLFYFMLLLMLVTFSEGILQLKWAYFSDEVLLCISSIIVCANVLFLKRMYYGNKLVIFLLLYVLLQLVNYIFSPYHLKFIFTLGQTLINIKAILVPLAFLIVMDIVKPKRKLIRGYLNVLIVLFTLGLLLNIIFQAEWNILLGWKIEYRYGFLRMAGWFGGTHYLGYFFTLVSLVLAMSHVLKRNGKLTRSFYFLYSALQVLVSFPLTLRKGLLSIFALMHYSLSSGNVTRILRISLISISLILGVYLFLGDSSYLSDTKLDILRMTNNDEDNYYIRGLMVYNGAALAVMHFPFGTGAGTFGTVLSKYNTLEVYQKVGIPSFWYEGEDLSGVYDSGFFSLLAENGFIGIVMMIMVFFYFSTAVGHKMCDHGKSIFNVLVITMAIWSVTEPVIQNGIFTVIFSTLIMFVVAKYKEENIRDEKS
jgi:hypothetical protein